MAQYHNHILIKVSDDDIVNGTFEIESGTICINSFAFQDCKKLKQITIPEGVKEIGPFAFRHCTRMRKIILPNSLESIGAGAFAFCHNLAHIHMKNIKFFGDGCFDCSLQSKPGIYKAFALTEFGELRCRDKRYELGKWSIWD